MTFRLLLVAMMILSLPAARADESDAGDKFFALGTECEEKNGGLEVHFYADSLIWVNGVRLATHEDDPYIRMKLGDIVVTGSPVKWSDYGSSTSLPAGDFYRYRLNLVADGKAYFTFSSFDDKIAQIGPHERRHSMGNLRSPELTFEVILPHIIFGLDGPNYLESSSGHVYRSK